MSKSFIDNNVTFNNVSASVNTGGSKISSSNYVYDEDGNIIESNPVVNSIDIDWNGAEVPGLDNPINSTGQLLSIIGNMNSSLEESQDNLSILTELQNEIKRQVQQIIDGQTQIGGSGNHVMLTLEEYNALVEKDPDTIYFIVDNDNTLCCIS